MPANLVSIIYNQLIANITLLKHLSLTSLFLSTMQLIMGSLLFSLSLSTRALRSTQLITRFPSTVSLSVSAHGSSQNWHLTPTGLSQSLSGSSSSFMLPSSFGVPQGSVLGPILFTIHVSHTASIVSSHGVNQRQYAGDIQLFVFHSLSSLSSSLCSLQRCVSFLHSWFITMIWF